MNRARALVLTSGLFVLVTAMVILSGCATTPLPPAPSTPAVDLSHVHELIAGQEDGDLLVATHEGLYRLTVNADGSAVAAGPLGGLDFDPMGFTIADGTAYASGHPGPTTPDSFGTPNLGLITSTDSAETWTNVSLTGETDFHSLAVVTSGDNLPHVFGVDPSRSTLQRSTDGGLTWSDGAELVARDILAVDSTLYATTPEGLAISEDDGMTFAVDPAGPPLFLVAVDHEGTLAGVDTTGTLWTRVADQEWARGRTVTGTPQAVAVDGARVYVADDRGIAFTEDGGATWRVLEVRG